MSGSHIGIVLAGGASRRMGRDKACLIVGGRSLLDRARATLVDANASAVWVLGRPDEPDGVPDFEPGAGPAAALAGAALAARQAGAARLLVIPVDMPGLAPQDLTALADACPGGVARYDGFVLPLAVDLTVSSDLDPAACRDKALRDLPWPVVAEPAAPEPLRLANLNTPDDVAAFEERVEERPA